MAAHQQLGAMRVYRVQAEDNGSIFSSLRLSQHQLTDVQTEDIGLDGIELAAKLRRGRGFEVPRIQGAQPAMEKQEDERDVVRRMTLFGGAGLEAEEGRQGQTQAEEARDAADTLAAALGSNRPWWAVALRRLDPRPVQRAIGDIRLR